MIFNSDSNYYEILEIRPDASAQDIRNAYLRLKASYRKDNPALYSVLDPTDTDDMIAKIEEAFHVLSDPDSRREYDERQGFAERIERKILSLDRAPQGPSRPSPSTSPDESLSGGDDLLNPPSTAFEGMATKGENGFSGSSPFALPTQTPSPFESAVRPESETMDSVPRPKSPAASLSSESNFVSRRESVGRRAGDRNGGAETGRSGDPVLAEIENETEWHGSFLRKLRELRRYSLDDIAQITKISKTYIIAIEEERFDKLPAPVFVRGFLLQIAKTLKIPTEPVAQAYMQRFQKRPGGA